MAWLRIILLALLAAAVLWLGPGALPAEAHQPRLVTGNQATVITKPAVSQAFYAELRGTPALYSLRVAGPTDLYFGLLVPDVPGRRGDFVAELLAGELGFEPPLAVLDGASSEWDGFYEPFAGDQYLKGPESTVTLPPGDYLIRVTSRDNLGKYVLAVGREERFSPAELWETITRLPAVKRYFGKSPWLALANLMGVFILLGLVAVVGTVWLITRYLGPLLRGM